MEPPEELRLQRRPGAWCADDRSVNDRIDYTNLTPARRSGPLKNSEHIETIDPRLAGVGLVRRRLV